jgi:hypothetical protein
LSTSFFLSREALEADVYFAQDEARRHELAQLQEAPRGA